MVKIYVQKEGKTEKTPIVKLEQGSKHVLIRVVNETGDRVGSGALALISLQGIELCDNIDKNIGFDLDRNGRLKVINGKERLETFTIE